MASYGLDSHASRVVIHHCQSLHWHGRPSYQRARGPRSEFLSSKSWFCTKWWNSRSLLLPSRSRSSYRIIRVSHPRDNSDCLTFYSFFDVTPWDESIYAYAGISGNKLRVITERNIKLTWHKDAAKNNISVRLHRCLRSSIIVTFIAGVANRAMYDQNLCIPPPFAFAPSLKLRFSISLVNLILQFCVILTSVLSSRSS